MIFLYYNSAGFTNGLHWQLRGDLNCGTGTSFADEWFEQVNIDQDYELLQMVAEYRVY